MIKLINMFSPSKVLTCCLVFSVNLVHAQLLWKITGSQLQGTSYLFGTTGSLCKDEFFVPAKVTAAFRESAILCTEIDMSKPEDPKKLEPLLMIPQGDPSLHDGMDSIKFDELLRYFADSLSLDLIKLQWAKPLLAATIVITRGIPCKQAVSIEKEMIATAIREKKSIVALENITDQVKIYDSIPDMVEGEILLSRIRNINKGNETYFRSAHAYRRQDLNELEALYEASEAERPYRSLFLADRHIAWIPKMKAQLTKGTVFFAVAAAHLAGDKGLIQLLRNEGFTVEPLPD
ncbi:TraB/GumN family protein [Chitinophaga sp. MM2321]|uniref:TraB/GumN family protein n=1 Tax=Chitinophaga sp. MM2321 TaxID=3137178 RepID=UPI0032D5A8A7